MDFEEKIDALRMNLELAFHDIEAMGVKIEALRVASASQLESILAQGENIRAQEERFRILANASESLLTNANRQQDDIDVLKKMSRRLGILVEAHEKRIAGIEGRI